MSVDGIIATIGQRVDPVTVAIEIDGVPLPVRPGLVYYLLYKPVDVVSTVTDTHDRPTVVDLVPAEPPVYPVGRLDADSEGLLLLTNDGDLTHRLTHPSFGVPKTYQVIVSGAVTNSKVARLVRDGIMLGDGLAQPIRAVVKGTRRDTSIVEVVLTEGRNREVRRMFEALGHPVDRLVRTSIGALKDPSLKPGTHRDLTSAEVQSLYATSSQRARMQ